MADQDERWYVFYRKAFVAECGRDQSLDFQTIAQLASLRSFVDTDYPLAILTSMQSVDAITPAFTETALPLLLLAVRYLRHSIAHDAASWAKSKMDRIESLFVPAMYELLAAPGFACSSTHELAARVLQEVLSISALSRDLVMKRLVHVYSASADRAPHATCFQTLLSVVSAQRNNLSLIALFSQVVVQLSLRQSADKADSVAKTSLRRGARMIDCYSLLVKTYHRLTRFLHSLGADRGEGGKACGRCVDNITCALCVLVAHSPATHALVFFDSALKSAMRSQLGMDSSVWRRTELVHVIEEALQLIGTDPRTPELPRLPADPPRAARDTVASAAAKTARLSLLHPSRTLGPRPATAPAAYSSRPPELQRMCICLPYPNHLIDETCLQGRCSRSG